MRYKETNFLNVKRRMEQNTQPELDTLQQPSFQEKLGYLIEQITANIHQEICRKYIEEPRVMKPYRKPPFEPRTVMVSEEPLPLNPQAVKKGQGMDFSGLIRYIENQIVYQKMIRQQNKEIVRAVQDFVATLTLTEEQRAKAEYLLHQLYHESQTVML